ncbi:MAG: phosphatidylglycerophosphatase A [Deltaproteobacteria bacterium]|nr:phosphatidylglycerophosphatase A [Deltaproteobacteria bacterium]
MGILDYPEKMRFSSRVALILSTWFGSGYAPVAPGTLGTLAAVPLVILVGMLGGGYGLFVLLMVTGVGIWASNRSRKLLGREDPSQVVIDEVAGYLLTLFLLPINWMTLTAGFFLFRIFDILKPWPVNRAEELKGGFGIVADDLIAGLYAHLILRAGLWVF